VASELAAGREPARRRKRPQSSAALKPAALCDETVENRALCPAFHKPERGQMPPSSPLTAPRNDRQLVFTSSQAALYLGVSLATIRRWTDAGHVGCYRTPGGQRRFSRVQLDSFITSMSQEGASETVASETVASNSVPDARVA
jgi:excisionase family DNA binding protein